MASNSNLIVHDNPYSRSSPPHRTAMEEWLARATAPLQHRFAAAFAPHEGAHAPSVGGTNTKQAVIATAGTLAAIAAARWWFPATSNVPVGLEAAAATVGLVGIGYTDKDSPSKATFIGVGAVGAGFLVARALPHLPARTHLPAAAPGATVHGEFGAEDPIIRAARAL